MNINIENFNTGWFGLFIGLKEKDIDKLISNLNWLKENKGNKTKNHFHFRSNYDGKSGVGDVEFYLEDDTVSDNMKFG
ncbi:MAG: hypothetical protein AB7S78_02885 [Candidatus Omnitrophota bacterium]